MTALDLKHLSIEKLNTIQEKIMDELSSRNEESNSSDDYIEEIVKVSYLEYDLKEELALLELSKESIEEEIDAIVDELERLENKVSDLDYKFIVDELK